MKRKKIAMLLVMALTLTQGVSVPAAAEELTAEDDLEMFQDGSDAEADDFIAGDSEAGINEEDLNAEVAEGFADEINMQETDGDDEAENGQIEYELYCDYLEGLTGNENMLPNSQMRIGTQLVCRTDEEEEEIEEYELQISSIEGAELADVSIQGRDLIVNSKDEVGDVNVSVEVLVDGKVVYTRSVYFGISEYVILPESVADAAGNAIELEVGEKLDIANDMKPQLVRYANGKGDPIPVTGDDYKIVIASWGDEETGELIDDYDENGWEKIDVAGQELPILERTSGYATWFALTAMKQEENGEWSQIARRIYDLDALPGYDGDDGGDEPDVNAPVLRPDTLEDAEGNKFNPQVGEAINFAKKGVGLYRYEEGEWYGIGDPETLKIEIEYDENDWSGQKVENWDMPIMTRKTQNATWLCFTAWEKNLDTGSWRELDTKTYEFEANDTIHSHSWETKEVIKDATCTEEGSKVEKCTSCEAEQTVSVPEKGHTVVKDAGVEATCESEGKTEGSHCSVCGKVLKAQEKVPAKGHTAVKDAAVEATCEGEGKTEGSHCSVCGKVLTEQKKVAAKGHTVVKDAAVAPTALAEGKTEGSHCSVCGKVLEKQNTVEKLSATISLTASSLKMKTGQSTTAFKATGFAEGDYVVAVTSDKPGTVKVTNVKSDGTFKLTAGKKNGSATITVTLASNKTASVKVTVQKTAVKTASITASESKLTLVKGDTYKKLASLLTVTPVTSKEKITYSSSDEKVASVSSNGVIKAKKAGTTKITVKSGSKKTVITVKVNGVKTTGLSGVPETKKISKGKTFKIKAAAAPKNTDEKITYKSSNKKVATVTSKGVVKGLRKGTATITVQSGSKKMICKVTVK